jgi:hypothetical protein
MGPEHDAETATHDDVLLPVDMGAHMGIFCKIRVFRAQQCHDLRWERLV